MTVFNTCENNLRYGRRKASNGYLNRLYYKIVRTWNYTRAVFLWTFFLTAMNLVYSVSGETLLWYTRKRAFRILVQ